MSIKVHASSLRQTSWHEYAVRFLFGGLITVLAGVVAKEFGPSIGGFFLAFPAIFPASATLIEKHERRKKQDKNLRGERRARQAVALDAAGAAMGSVGLMVFAVVVWQFLIHGQWLTLLAATMSWFTVSILIWLIRERWI